MLGIDRRKNKGVQMIGEKIKSARRALHMTQEQLAKKIGVTRGAVAQWEANMCKPTVESIMKVASATNSEFNWMFDTEGTTIKKEMIAEINSVPSGWRCPACKKIYSPMTNQCPRC